MNIDEAFSSIAQQVEEPSGAAKMAYEEQCVRAVLSALSTETVSEFHSHRKMLKADYTFDTLHGSFSYCPVRLMLADKCAVASGTTLLSVMQHPENNGFLDVYYDAKRLVAQDNRPVAVFMRTAGDGNFVVYDGVFSDGPSRSASRLIMPKKDGKSYLVLEMRKTFVQLLAIAMGEVQEQ